VQEEKMIRLLGAGTLSVLVVIICLVAAILTRPKAVAQPASLSSNANPSVVNVATTDQTTMPQTTAQSSSTTIQPTVAGVSTPATSGQKYTVQAGDTLYDIATKLNKNWKDIAKANNITDAGSLHEGQELIIP
jgi:LysM repeat protein